jgi:hypothetical protein
MRPSGWCDSSSDAAYSGHMLGNSIALLRQYHALGVRYVTLTHTCHNVFADSCGYAVPSEPLHGGLRSVLYLRLLRSRN